MPDYRIGAAILAASDDGRWCRTTFPDGTHVDAAGNDDPASLALAAELGYGRDTGRMSVEHESIHSLLAEWRGLPWSPTLWSVAHPGHPGAIPRPGPGRDAEEWAVIAAQRAIRAGVRDPGGLAQIDPDPARVGGFLARARAFLDDLPGADPASMPAGGDSDGH